MKYQERCSTRAEVKALYERVCKNPAIERYRGYTSVLGEWSYGWNPIADDYVKVDGEHWFNNPNYIPEVDKPPVTMTYREKLEKEHPECVNPDIAGGCEGCPSDYGYDSIDNEEKNCKSNGGYGCECCWDRQVPQPEKFLTVQEAVERLKKAGESLSLGYKEGIEHPETKPRILDSGNRRQFETGAVRDICEGKGRCDLLPLDVVAEFLDSGNIRNTESLIFHNINNFVQTGDEAYLDIVLDWASKGTIFENRYAMLLEVAKHFEEGCKKYGENNWQKGIPTHCYIDSAVRHYLKYLRGDKDEPHDRAFCWNILCCIWTCIHKPELNDYRKEENTNEKDN